MIVHKHNRCRIELQCSFEYDAWIEDELGQAALLQLLVRYETAGSVEEQNPKYFFGKAPHRGLEIGNEFRISRRDSPAHKARSEERRVGKSVSVRVDLGGRRIIKKNRKTLKNSTHHIVRHM